MGKEYGAVVVSAAIVDTAAKQVLLAQRTGTTSHPRLWCTPGGKVEPEERHTGALARELREELGVVMMGGPGQVLYQQEIESTRTGKLVLVVCYVVHVEALMGKPQAGDATMGIGWFGVDVLRVLPMAPADHANRHRFAALLEGS